LRLFEDVGNGLILCKHSHGGSPVSAYMACSRTVWKPLLTALALLSEGCASSIFNHSDSFL
jgi:hypothetical protein